MSTFANAASHHETASGHDAYNDDILAADESMLRRLLRDLQVFSSPVRKGINSACMAGGYGAAVPAILKLSPIAQAAASASAVTERSRLNASERDILLVRTVERLLTGNRELTFTEGRLQPHHEATVGSSITSTFTIPMVRG